MDDEPEIPSEETIARFRRMACIPGYDEPAGMDLRLNIGVMVGLSGWMFDKGRPIADVLIRAESRAAAHAEEAGLEPLHVETLTAILCRVANLAWLEAKGRWLIRK